MENLRLGARLRAARKAAGFKTSKNFLKKSKIPASTYSQHESGARIPDDETIKFYCNAFQVNFNWLKNGKGIPFNLNTSMSNSNILEEEVLDLDKYKKVSVIDHNLLSLTLLKVVSTHAPGLSKTKIKKIISETIKLYESKADTF